MSQPTNLYKGEGPRQIGLYVYLKALTDINCVAQTFKVKLYLYLAWAPTEEEYNGYLKDETYVPSFNPEIRPQNIVENTTEDNIGNNTVHILRNGERDAWGQTVNLPEGWVFFGKCTMFVNTLSTGFDMRNFPFDMQNLHIIFEADEISSVTLLVPSLGYFPERNSLDFEMGTLASDVVYDILDPIIEFNAYDLEYKAEGDSKEDCWSTAVFTLKVKRNYSGYVWRILMLISLLEIMNVCVFFLDHFSDLGNRLGVTVTILLAMVAFQYIVMGSMPSVPYLSYADKFVLSCFVYAFAVCAYTCIGSVDSGLGIEDGETGEPWLSAYVDHCVGLAFVCVWAAKLIFFYVYFKHEESKDLPMLTMSYKELNDAGLIVGDDKGRILSAKKENNRYLYQNYKDSYEKMGYDQLSFQALATKKDVDAIKAVNPMM